MRSELNSGSCSNFLNELVGYSSDATRINDLGASIQSKLLCIV